MAANDQPEPLNPLHPSVADKLNAEFTAIYNENQAYRLRVDQVPYEVYNANRTAYGFTIPPSQLIEKANVTTHRILVSEPSGEIEADLYTPTGTTTANTTAAAAAAAADDTPTPSPLPLLINFHGGGFVLGDLQGDATLCHRLAQQTPCAVLNVAYRLAPDHPHPVPFADAYSALKWAAAHASDLGIDRTRIAVSGISAGACLAAACALAARDDDDNPLGLQVVAQVLVVPLLDARYIPESGRVEPDKVPYESYVSCEFAPMLPVSRLMWFYHLWLGTGKEREHRAADWRASPMVAASLAGLAPASLHVAGVDPLRSEAEAYHDRMLREGTRSRIKIYEGVGHSFGHWEGQLAEGRELVRDIVVVLKEAFAV